MSLKTNYQDAKYDGLKKYKEIDNGDGTISLEDVTEYSQEGSSYGAEDINELNKIVNSATSDVSDETERAKEAENTLSDMISAEVERATDAETELQDVLSDETERAVNVENQLVVNLTTETNRAKEAESNLSTSVASLEADNVTNKKNIQTNADDIDSLEAKNFVQLIKILNSSNITVTGGEKTAEGVQQFTLEVTGQTPSELSSNLTFFNNNPQQMIASNILLELDSTANTIVLRNFCFVKGEITEKTSSISLSTDEFKIVDSKLTLAKEYLTTSDASNTYLTKNNAQLTYANKTELTTETANRTKGDTALQTQIDAINSRSDVVDVVATKADLDAYDKDITVDDIIKVLQDETQNDATSYYRNTATAKPYTWELVGVLGQYYTKSQTDTLVNNEKTRAEAVEILKVNTTDIIDDLTHSDTAKPLSANQGKVLKGYLDNGNLVINTNTDIQFYKTAGDRKRLMLRPTGPKDITSYYKDGTLWTRITNGFDDIYVGDYFDMGTAVSAYEQTQAYQTTGSQWITIADFNLPYNKGDSTKANVNTICCIPGKGLDGSYHFGRSRMNSTNTTIGGYTATEMDTITIGAVATEATTPAATDSINQQLYNIFGSHLATTRELLCNANTSGTPSGWAWFDKQAVLMSEEEVYGSKVWGNSGYNVGIAWQQLALFQLYPRMVNNRSSYYWLKNIVSASTFAYVRNNGFAYYNDASDADSYVRPRFILRP